MTENFALIGAAGYIAPRHMNAIKSTGNILRAALDPNDSVGIIDTYFPHADFFTEFERFDRHIDKLRRTKSDEAIKYISICSPNYLHDSHIRFALRSGTHVICEKPLVLNPWNIEALKVIEQETGKKVFSVLQLRHHPSIIKLKNEIALSDPEKIFNVDLTYITSRGKWYHNSWKGDVKKSGGITSNIGVHFFDLLHFLFGKNLKTVLHYLDKNKGGGYLEFERARVKWFLSIDEKDIPADQKMKGKTNFRSLIVDDIEVELSENFKDLHSEVYHNIINGNGFGLEDNMPVIETIATIRTQEIIGLKGDYHPFLKNAS